jgi:hypothetical protein
MKRITNKTQKPLRVPLPGGKTLHLGPGKEAEVSFKAVDHPGVRALVEAGALAVVGDGTTAPSGAADGAQRDSSREAGAAPGGRRSGDR